MQAEGLIQDYLRRLDAAAVDLPAERRGELAAEVRDHIDAALSEAGTRDEVTVRNVLERLGRPDVIVSAEAEPAPPQISHAGAVAIASTRPSGLSRVGATEIAALLLLTVGGFLLPVVGPLIGLIFLWLSTLWSTRQKVIASVIVITLFVMPVLLILTAGTNIGVLP